jgi:hypothetical protein
LGQLRGDAVSPFVRKCRGSASSRSRRLLRF